MPSFIDDEMSEIISDLTYAKAEEQILKLAVKDKLGKLNLRKVMDKAHEYALEIAYGDETD